MKILARRWAGTCYDYDNHPLARCIESLLYESPCYKREIQSFRIFSLKRDDSRPYYMSTPWPGEPNDVE